MAGRDQETRDSETPKDLQRQREKERERAGSTEDTEAGEDTKRCLETETPRDTQKQTQGQRERGGGQSRTGKQGEALRRRDSKGHQKHRDTEERERVWGTWKQGETNRDTNTQAHAQQGRGRGSKVESKERDTKAERGTEGHRDNKIRRKSPWPERETRSQKEESLREEDTGDTKEQRHRQRQERQASENQRKSCMQTEEWRGKTQLERGRDRHRRDTLNQREIQKLPQGDPGPDTIRDQKRQRQRQRHTERQRQTRGQVIHEM